MPVDLSKIMNLDKNQLENTQKISRIKKIAEEIEKVIINNEMTLGEVLFVFDQLRSIYQRKASEEFKIK